MNKPYILCVDDDKSILLSLKVQLQHYLGSRFQYEAAESAAEAWELIDELSGTDTEIAVIICDYIMPSIKGDEFLIRVHQKHPKIVKIMLTGHADQSAVSQAREEAQLAACFGKPWNIDELLTCINEALKKL